MRKDTCTGLDPGFSVEGDVVGDVFLSDVCERYPDVKNADRAKKDVRAMERHTKTTWAMCGVVVASVVFMVAAIVVVGGGHVYVLSSYRPFVVEVNAVEIQAAMQLLLQFVYFPFLVSTSMWALKSAAGGAGKRCEAVMSALNAVRDGRFPERDEFARVLAAVYSRGASE